MDKKPTAKGRVPGFPTAGKGAARGEKAGEQDEGRVHSGPVPEP